MAASKNNNLPAPDLALPTSIVQTMRLVQRIAQNATWGERIAAQHQLPAAASFGSRLFRRFDAASTPGVWASAFAQRFATDELTPSTTDLTLAPYAPAQRQVSAARQGALPWSGGDDFSAAWPTGSIDRSPEPSAHHSLFNDLATSGWDVQSSAPAPVQRFAEPMPASGLSQPAAPPLRRAPDPQPAAQPIQRAPDPQSAAQPTTQAMTQPTAQPAAQPAAQPTTQPAAQPTTQSQSTLHRQADTPDASSSSSEHGSTDEVAQTGPDESPAIETAATRPMSFFRGTPQNPLMRMGLSESPGDEGDRAAAPSAPVSTPSGELPVVRRSADQPASPAVTPARIDRREEPMVVPAQPSAPANEPSITSSKTTDREDAPPEAAANNSVDVQRSAVPDASVQRATPAPAPADTSAAISAPTPASIDSQPSNEIARVAADPATVLGDQGGGQATSAAADHAAQPPTSTAPEHVGSAAPDQGDSATTSDRHAAAATGSSAPTTIARAPIELPSVAQRSGDTAAPAAETSGSGAANDGTTQPNAVAAEHVINRKAVPSASPQAFETVLPWATKLLQRYSMGDGPSTAAPMPLLRTHAASSAMTMMRSSDQLSGAPLLPVARSGIVDGSVSSAMPGVTSASSAISLPLIRRSAITPALPQATLQREPATTSGGPIAAAAPAPVAPSPLDWSALPLLQRLSVQHVVPAAPAAPSTAISSAGAGGQSVAARLVQRLALDDPQATTAPMPLLRTQAPAQPSTLMRSMPQAGNAAIGGAIPGHVPASMPTGADSGSPFADDQPSADLGAIIDQAAPLIHRSAILPTWSGSASQPLPLLRTHIPDAPNVVETRGWNAMFQPMPQPALGAPIAQHSSPVAMRAADQQGEPAALSALPEEQSTAGISATLSSSAVPLVHRSAITPALPQATLQREPATASGGSIAAAGPAPVAPSGLDWSALPLLQRLSVQHVVPASPAAPAAPSSSQNSAPRTSSVAARLVQRFALDDPHGTAAPMPLLRMQAPVDIASHALESNDSEAGAPGAHSFTADAPILPALVRRSAILPSLSSFGSPEPGFAQAAAGAETDLLQRSDSVNDWSAPPILQRSFGAFAGGLNRLRAKIPTLPSPASALGGLDQSFGNLGQHAQSALGHVTSGLPSPASALGGLGQSFGSLGQHAQSALGQVTSGLPSPGSALGGLDQSFGGLGQHAQSALGQVTSAMPQLPLLQQMNWRSAQQALGISNLGIPNLGIPNAGISSLDNAGEALGANSMPDMAAGLGESPVARGAAPELPLLKPTRPEPQAAAEQSQSASAGEGAASESADSTSGAPAGAAGATDAAGKQGKHDIEQLAQQVYARLRHRLLVDRERLRPF